MQSPILATRDSSPYAQPAVRKTRKKPIPPNSERQHPLVIQLRKYAQHFGDFECELLEAAHRIHQRASSSDASMRLRIQKAIHEGCSAVDDIVEDTGIDEQICRRICDELIADGEYEKRPIGLKTDFGRGRRPKGIFHKSDRSGESCRVFDRRGSYYENDEPEDD